MPKFTYTCKDINQNTVNDSIDAESINAAITALTTRGLYPVSVLDEREAQTNTISLKNTKVSAKYISLFTRQLSDLLSSGITLLRALEIVESQSSYIPLKKITSGLVISIKDGSSFSAALEKYPKTFSGFYVNMVKAGEASGSLDHILSELAQTSENEEEMKSQIRGAFAYPLFIIVVGIITTFILMSFVIPQIAGIFLEIDQPLPFVTKTLIALSSFINTFWWLLLLVGVAMVLFIIRLKKSSEGRSLYERFFLKIPIISTVYKNNQIARFARSLSTMLHNGVHILNALKITQSMIYSEQFKKEIETSNRDIKKGKRLGDALKASVFLPLSTQNIISIGEEGGQLEKALEKAAVIHEKEMNRTLKLATSLLEPVLILAIGIVVGFVVLAMLWPIFEINVFIK